MDDSINLLRDGIFKAPGCYLAWPALAMCLGAMLGWMFPATAKSLSIVPRSLGGLLGIVTAPFVHFGIAHLIANLPAFLILGVLVLRKGPETFLVVSAGVALAQGLLVWLFGRSAAHAGMSGVIFGYFGYLAALGWFAHTNSDLLVATAVAVVYGGMLSGIAPARGATSWEGHLFGLLSGVGAAWLASN